MNLNQKLRMLSLCVIQLPKLFVSFFKVSFNLPGLEKKTGLNDKIQIVLI